MFRKSTLFAFQALLLAAVAFDATSPAVAAPVRIMPLGDSITAGPGCWRAFLWNQLRTAGYTNIDFVGSVSDGGGCNPGFAYDFDHEGHSGFSATGIADNNQLPPWLNAGSPDIVLMHLGTNDMWGGYIPTDTKIAAFTKLVGQMRANNPNMKIIIAQIIPMSQSACATCPADVVAFNNRIPAWAAGLTTAQSPIVVVDQWTGFDAVADTGDGVHPNDAGFRKMADRWYPPLAHMLDGIVPPLPSTSPSRSAGPSASASASPSASVSGSSGGTTCSASYRVISQWGGAFQGEVAVKNATATASSAWTATFTFANGQQVTQSWNTTLTQSGATVTARNAGYNGSLAPGASTSFGFLASWSNSTNALPAVSCVLR